MMRFAAQRFFIDHGSSAIELDEDQLRAHIPAYLPDHCMDEKNIEYWLEQTSKAYRESTFANEQLSPEKVKEDIVNYARHQWPFLFARFFTVYKATGPTLPKRDVLISVSWIGVCFVDRAENVLVDLSFPDITGISCGR